MTMAADKFGLQVYTSHITTLMSNLNVIVLCQANIFASALFQVSIHAIGDKANDLILDVYKSVGSTNGMRDRRFRVNLVFETWKKKTQKCF